MYIGSEKLNNCPVCRQIYCQCPKTFGKVTPPQEEVERVSVESIVAEIINNTFPCEAQMVTVRTLRKILPPLLLQARLEGRREYRAELVWKMPGERKAVGVGDYDDWCDGFNACRAAILALLTAEAKTEK